jgi:hypothetical protein
MYSLGITALDILHFPLLDEKNLEIVKDSTGKPMKLNSNQILQKIKLY